MPTKGNIAFSAVISLLTEVTYCLTDMLYRSSCAMTSIKTMHVASQKLYILAKFDCVSLHAVQTYPPCVGIVYGSHDACNTSIRLNGKMLQMLLLPLIGLT